MERLLGDLCLFKNQHFPNLGELKNCIGGVVWRVLESLDKLLKYNIPKIKDILMVNTILSFYTKSFFQKMFKIS